MKITYLSSPISSQYGGGEKFLDDFTAGIEGEHQFIGSSKAVYDLFVSKGYKATLTSGLFEPVSPRNLLLIPISILVGLFQFIRFYNTFKASDWIISPTSHCETFFVIPWIKLFLNKKVMFMIHAPKVPKLFSISPLNYLLSRFWGCSPVVFVSNSQKQLWNSVGCDSSNQIVIYNGVKIEKLDSIDSTAKRNFNKTKPVASNSPLEGWQATPDGAVKSDALNPPDGIFRYPQDDETLGDSDFEELNSKTLKIGFLARLHSEKGCDVLINALEHIKSDEQIEIIIAGDRPEKQNLVNLYKSKNLPDNIKVSFKGFQSDTKSFYQSLDLFVFPSRRESFGLVICEAMERGKSVICSNIPSSLEVKKVLDITNETNLIFQKDNLQDLAQKIDYFISNQEVYLDEVYKQELHDTITKKFSLEKMIVEYKKVLSIS
jgi:glycosyltransferase involved in cell wall biosynthesis